ncbi:outer membrane protein transport protein [Methylobacillus flagellatus]|uniref:OmpP1/FadL family transporter n=1 Tax=Methylobacillus flagellatus TaxID=405 RepID=UPI002853954E|nr:outer membrane protein transport protein [Methylobacillus flagellatus]MDR5172045.1 outer membrane protein transport protein [Methylobacillus flagellatus]
MIKRLCFLSILGISSGVNMTAHAAGFALIEQSASGFGNAYAGMAARADDASIQFFNPASLSWLPAGRQIVLGGSAILPSAKLRNADASHIDTTNGARTPISGNNGGDVGSLELVPNFYFATDLGQDLKFGIGVTVPYGLTSEYEDGWKGRYQGLKSEVMTINVNPALSFKANDKLSVGGGVSLQYVKAELTNALDSSALLGVGQGGNPVADSYSKMKGEDISWGFNLGVIYKPWETTTLGASYRSHIKHELEGKATFRPVAPLAAFLRNTDISAELSMPETVSFSGAQKLNDRLELLADITWTNWSRFKELRVKFDSVLDDNVTTTKWDDSYRVSLGGNYRYNDQLTLRAGVAYDQTPVPNSSHRTPRIPDADRTWFAVGASWKLDPLNTIEVGYAYLRMKDSSMNHSSEGAVRHNIQGEFSSRVDILSAQWSRSF